MKTFAALLILLSTAALAQTELKYADLPTYKKFKAGFSSYTAKNGTVYKVGEMVPVGTMSGGGTEFKYILIGDGLLQPATPASSTYSGKDLLIQEIYVDGNRSDGFTAFFRCKGGPLFKANVKIESALETGEIKSLVMSSDEALASLKKAKEKLDLGLITQAEYDKIKSELAALIN